MYSGTSVGTWIYANTKSIWCIHQSLMIANTKKKEIVCQVMTEALLNPGVHPRAGNQEVSGIPQVDSITSQRQLTSMHAEVTYLI